MLIDQCVCRTERPSVANCTKEDEEGDESSSRDVGLTSATWS